MRLLLDGPASLPVNSIKTRRYLHLAIPSLVLLILSALTIERFAGGRRRVQDSVSSYYDTPGSRCAP